MLIKDRYAHILHYFETNVPVAETELHYTNPFELLVAVALSAQCTDKRVNLVTPALFNAYPTCNAMAQATADDIFKYIRSINFPVNKSKHLATMARQLVNDFNSEVPSKIIELVTLQGVGRKTANVIASVIFNQPTMAVDTHVFRVSARLGLTNAAAKTPLASELQLIKHIPKALVPRAHHWLILHGRYTCVARTPKCAECALTQWCKYYATQQRASNKK
ncbi:MAG: endonuclease III [Bacteroidia bacterium]|nr:endonuclease III [Bacteroidia bacterium]